MRVVIQRVAQAEVRVDEQIVGAIHQGFLIFLGICTDDSPQDVDWLVQKIIKLRIFSDENGKMNHSIIDIQGDILLVSQFTLYALTHKGNRPSYIKAAKPDQAVPLYESMITSLESALNHKIETGIFGADMQISLTNDGPVTIIIDSKTDDVRFD